MKRFKVLCIVFLLLLSVVSFGIGCKDINTDSSAAKVTYQRNGSAGSFKLLSPSNESTINGRMPTFKWESAGDGVLYTLKIAKDEGFEVLAFLKSNLTATTFELTESLALKTTYFWQVVAIGKDNQTVSDTWQFHCELSGEDAEVIVPLNKSKTCNEGGMTFNHSYSESEGLSVSWEQNSIGWGVLRENVSCYLDSGDALFIRFKYSSADSISIRLLENDTDLWVCNLPLKTKNAFYECVIPYTEFTRRDDESFGDGELSFEYVQRFDLVVGSFEDGSCVVSMVKCVNKEDYAVEKVSKIELSANVDDYAVNSAGYQTGVSVGEFISSDEKAVKLSYQSDINSVGWGVVSFYADCELEDSNAVNFDYFATGAGGSFALRFVEEDNDMWVANFNAISGLASSASISFTDLSLREDESFGDKKISMKKLRRIDFVVSAYEAGSIAIGNITFTNEQAKTTDLTFNGVFGDYMVLQRNKETSINGKCLEGSNVVVEFNGKEYTAVVKGTAWECKLPVMSAGGDYTISATDGINNSEIKHVTFGDVYLFSGQSNMLFKLAQATDDKTDINNSQIRLFFQSENAQDAAQDNCKNSYWVPAINDSALQTSAIAWYTANIIQKDVDVPIGILYAAVGDTSIKYWMSEDAYSGSEKNANRYYNGMINPLTYMDINGIVWYQGENDCGWPEDYKTLLSDMIDDMRSKFGDDDLSYYIISLPIYNHPYNWAYIRESQEEVCLTKNNVHLVNTLDKGNVNDIHPTEKKYISERLANLMLKYNYGQTVDADMPYASNYEFSEEKAIITIANGDGLKLTKSASFEIAGADGVFYEGVATVSDNKVVVTSESVTKAMYVRYAFGSVTEATLFNGENLPVNSFRSYDDCKHICIDLSAANVDKEYFKGGDNENWTISNDGKSLCINYNKTAGWGILRLNAYTEISGGEYLVLKLTKTGEEFNTKIRITEVDGDTWESAKLSFDANGIACVKYSDMTWIQGWGDKSFDRNNLILQIDLVFENCYGSGTAVLEYIYSGDLVENSSQGITPTSVIDNFDDATCVNGWTLSHEYGDSTKTNMTYTTEEKISGDGAVLLQYTKKLGNSIFEKTITQGSLSGDTLSFWLKGDDECVMFFKITDKNGTLFTIQINQPSSVGKRYSYDLASIWNDDNDGTEASKKLLSAANITSIKILIQDWNNGEQYATASICLDELIII